MVDLLYPRRPRTTFTIRRDPFGPEPIGELRASVRNVRGHGARGAEEAWSQLTEPSLFFHNSTLTVGASRVTFGVFAQLWRQHTMNV